MTERDDTDDLELGGWFSDYDEADFCLIHGYEFMKTDRGPIAYCSECDRLRTDGEAADGK